MEIIKLREDYIKLGQALKAANLVENGVEAKIVIQNGQVLVNGKKELQRGKKLTDGDFINAGYMVLNPEIFDYLDGDETVFEKYPLEQFRRHV